jgi:sensor histidine kinase YesM
MPTQTVHQRKLRNYLLNPEFQFRLLGYFVGLFFLTTVSLYSASYLFFWRLNQKALNVGIPPGHVFFKFISNQKHDLDLVFIILTLVNLLLLLGTGIIVSHRIAGPFYKLKKYLKEIGPDSETFRLRDKDFFRDIEAVVNSLKDRIK